MIDPAIDRAKRAIRQQVWDVLEREGAAPPGVHGHIPDFAGTDQAAARLAELDIWRAAAVVMVNPDRAQLPVRIRALRDGKLLYVAVPRLAGPKPFYRLDPATLSIPFEEAATAAGAATVARAIGPDEMRSVDLVICGSVAVNHNGARIGKGAGFSDIEVGLLHDAGLLGPESSIATTVHDLQVLDQPLAEAPHDFRLDYIVTPTAAYVAPTRTGHPRQDRRGGGSNGLRIHPGL